MNAAPFDEARRLIGSYAAIGAIFTPPVSPQGVSKWVQDGVPAERVLPIARATGFAVTPHQLRPDLYPHPDDGLPADARANAAGASHAPPAQRQ